MKFTDYLTEGKPDIKVYSSLVEADSDKKIVSVGQKTKGVMVVQTKDGKKYEVTAKDTGGDMPKVGKLITDYIDINEAVTWSDMDAATDELFSIIEKAIKGKGDVNRTGASNGFHIKMKSGAVAHVVFDPHNKF